MSGISSGGGATGPKRSDDDDDDRTPAAPTETEKGQQLTEDALESHGHQHRHQLECHEKAVAAGGEERSLTHLPSASTHVDRVDEEGQSLLHRGGGSGGVYDSVGTMSQMSGVDPSPYGGGIFRPGGGGGGASGGAPPLKTSGSDGSFVRTASAGEDSVESGSAGGGSGSGSGGGGGGIGNNKGGGAATRPPMPRRPKTMTGKSRKVSWGVSGANSDVDGVISGADNDGGVASAGTRNKTLDRRGILQAEGSVSRNEDPLRSSGAGHRRGPSFADMVRGLATSVGKVVKSSRNLLGDSSEGGGEVKKDKGDGKEGARELWGRVHKRIDSVILRGQDIESDFDFSKVDLDEKDLADLQAAGIPCEDGKVLETPAEIEERGGTARKVLSIIQKRAKRESLLEKAQSMRRKFDVSVKECVIAIGVYLAMSVVAYSLVFETWPVVDSLYFAVVTFTTIGYGDLTPSTVPGQAFMCFFGLAGVASLGLALGVIGSDIIEGRVKAADSAREEAREISHREVLHLFDDDEDSKSEATESSERSGLLRSSSKQEGEDASCMARCCKPFWSETAKNSLLLLVILLSGCIIIALLEGWSIFTGIYYGIVTSCTIGYGDISPTEPATRFISVFFIPFAVAVMGQFLGAFSTYVMEERQNEFRQALRERDLKTSHLEGMSSAGNGIVTKLDYVEFMLQAMDMVDRELLDELHATFDKLDNTGDGVLTEDDLKLIARKKLRSAKKKLELAEYKSNLLRKPARHTSRTQPGDTMHMSLAEAVESVL